MRIKTHKKKAVTYELQAFWLIVDLLLMYYKHYFVVLNCQLSYLIFFEVPHLFNQWRGEALSRGEREIRDEVSFQAS
jgi:hypothetical protein